MTDQAPYFNLKTISYNPVAINSKGRENDNEM